MKRFAFTLVVLACLPAAGLAAQPDSETVAAERQIRQKLNQPAGIEFVVTPLRDVVQNLRNRLQIDIRLDLPALKEVGVDESTPVTFTSRPSAPRPDGREVKEISLGPALKLLLDPMHLRHVVRDGALWITSRPTPEQRIREALDEPTQIEFVDTPLKDVVDYLKDLHHIEIQLDGPAMKEAGVEELTPVTRNLKGISLRSALRLMLDQLRLTSVIHDEVLLITSRAKATSDEFLETRAYSVQDLAPPDRDGAVDLQPLKAVLTTIAAETWSANKGYGSIAAFVVGDRALLVVSQTQEVHEQIASVLEILRREGGLKTASQHVGVDEAAERRIREALDQPTQIEFVDTPLKDVIDYLKDLHHIEIQTDDSAFKEGDVGESVPVNKNLKGISLRSALKTVLDELALTYVVRHGVLLITTPTRAQSNELMEARVYPVADLALPDHRGGPLDLKPLKDLLTTTTRLAEAGTCSHAGGGIAAIVVGNRPLLVVWETEDVHEQVQATLELLRKTGGLKDPDAAPKANVIHLKQAEEHR